MNKTPVLNLFGGPGIGKSTIASGVFSLLKQHGINCELVTEFAKDLTWECRKKTLLNQRYIFGKQYHRQWRVRDEVDVIITDSPLLLGIYYNSDTLSDFFVRDVIVAWNEFDNINFFLNRVKPYNPKGRNQKEEEAIIIDNELKILLNTKGEDYKIVDGDYTGINIITREMLSTFDMEIKIRFEEY